MISSRSFRCAPMVRPRTFSNTKYDAFSSTTRRTKWSTSEFRGSSSARLPIMLKPWHGAPPKRTSTGRSPMREWSRIYLPSISATLRQMAAQSGKLNSCVAQWIGSYSTAAATSNPACSKPRLIPPAPANRSTPMGLFPLSLIKRKPYRMLAASGGGGQHTILWRCERLKQTPPRARTIYTYRHVSKRPLGKRVTLPLSLLRQYQHVDLDQNHYAGLLRRRSARRGTHHEFAAGGGARPTAEPGDCHGAPGGAKSAGGRAGPEGPVRSARLFRQRTGIHQRISDEHRRCGAVRGARARLAVSVQPAAELRGGADQGRGPRGRHRGVRQERRRRLPHGGAFLGRRTRGARRRDGAQGIGELPKGAGYGREPRAGRARIAARIQAGGTQPGARPADRRLFGCGSRNRRNLAGHRAGVRRGRPRATGCRGAGRFAHAAFRGSRCGKSVTVEQRVAPFGISDCGQGTGGPGGQSRAPAARGPGGAVWSVRHLQSLPGLLPQIPAQQRRGRRCCAGIDRKSTRLNSSHLVISY